MSINVRAAAAIRAMKEIGIPEKKVKRALKDLLKVYDKNWELIEDENYRVLADAIFEFQDNEAEEEARKTKEDQLQDESAERPLKRLRLRHQSNQDCPSGETSLRRTPLEEAGLPEDCPQEESIEPINMTRRGRSTEQEPSSPQLHLRGKQKEHVSYQSASRQDTAVPSALIIRERRSDSEPVSPLTHSRDKAKEPISSHIARRPENEPVSPLTRSKDKGKEPVLPHIAFKDQAVALRSTSAVCIKEPKVEPGIILLPKENSHNPQNNNALIKPKPEPFTDDSPQFEVPIAIMPPPDRGHTSSEDPVHKDGCSVGNGSIGQGMDSEPSVSQDVCDDDPDKAHKSGCDLELANVPETSPANVEIASSPQGEVRISLSCNYASARPDFHMPSLEAVLKAVEDKCLRSYQILEPNFSMMKLMQEMCQCFLELSIPTNNTQESFIHLTHNLDFLKKTNLQDALGAKSDQRGDFWIPTSSLDESPNGCSPTEVAIPEIASLLPSNASDDLHCPVPLNNNLAAIPQQKSFPGAIKQFHDVNDIAKGEEKVRISFINEVSSASHPSPFYYIPRNICYQNAYVNFSLARIGDEDCCSGCFGDCLSSSIPCACARETGGEFAYTLEGLVKEKLLDECISMNRDPQQHQHYYCKDCPLERSKNEGSPGKCKGHLVRKFIKECWSKCGCNMQCGNRVVQRGIACNLQVFFTSEGKGWGLRTLEDLPRGSFVCEYVGEILTNSELDERNTQSSGDEEHTYPVLLDADWGSEGVLKDEEALCLDATLYGNVARFINHRCFDANLVEIPVEIETPDHHYYHLAFFTTRNVDALEELTWDYGIDFDDHSHPVKAFRCRCGSKCCRDMKRSRRSKSKALVLK